MKLPRALASTPPPRETGLVRADPRALTDTGDAGFGAVAGAGRAISNVAAMGFDALQKRQALDDQIAQTEANVRAQEAIRLGTDAIAEYDVKANQPLPDNPETYFNGDKLNPFDTAARVKFETDLNSDLKNNISNLSSAIKNPKTRRLWEAQTFAAGQTAHAKALNNLHNEHQTTTLLGYATTAAQNGNEELAGQFVDIAEKHGLIGPKRAAAERIDLAELAVKSEVKSLYMVGDYQAARDVATESQLGITEKESLLNTINLIEERNEKKTKDLNYKKDMAVNDDFMTKVATGDLFPDEIKESRLPEKAEGGIFATGKLSQTEWLNYAKASYQGPPRATVPDGYSTANDIVLGYASKELSRETAYRKLLDARYTRKQMTDNDFVWAANRIADPFEKSFAADLSAVVAENNKTLQGIGFFDKKRFSDKEKAEAMIVNRGLIDWAEARLKENKPPTRAEMEQKAAELIAGGEVPVEVDMKDMSDEDLIEAITGGK